MTPEEKAMTAFPFTKGTNQMNQMPEQMEMYVILVGNPRDGFRVIGPFKTGDDADEYIDTEPENVDWMTVVPLEVPAYETGLRQFGVVVEGDVTQE